VPVCRYIHNYLVVYNREIIARLQEIINLAHCFWFLRIFMRGHSNILSNLYVCVQSIRHENFLFAGYWMEIGTICSILKILQSLWGEIMIIELRYQRISYIILKDLLATSFLGENKSHRPIWMNKTWLNPYNRPSWNLDE